MSFRILYVTATSSEAEAIRRIKGIKAIPGGYQADGLEIIVLIAGVGSIATAWTMQKWISVNEKPDLAINSGIAGSYNHDISIGEVVMPVTDCFADAGIEDGNNFLTLSEAGLINASEFPFKEGLLLSDPIYANSMKNILRPVRAITVNMATGSDSTRDRLVKKFNPDIETMEGATFFYICIRENISFMALRSISNIVEPRDKSKWDIRLALNNLSEKLDEVLLTLK
jgi:futalosine hydrolase